MTQTIKSCYQCQSIVSCGAADNPCLLARAFLPKRRGLFQKDMSHIITLLNKLVDDNPNLKIKHTTFYFTYYVIINFNDIFGMMRLDWLASQKYWIMSVAKVGYLDFDIDDVYEVYRKETFLFSSYILITYNNFVDRFVNHFFHLSDNIIETSAVAYVEYLHKLELTEFCETLNSHGIISRLDSCTLKIHFCPDMKPFGCSESRIHFTGKRINLIDIGWFYAEPFDGIMHRTVMRGTSLGMASTCNLKEKVAARFHKIMNSEELLLTYLCLCKYLVPDIVLLIMPLCLRERFWHWDKKN